MIDFVKYVITTQIWTRSQTPPGTYQEEGFHAQAGKCSSLELQHYSETFRHLQQSVGQKAYP